MAQPGRGASSPWDTPSNDDGDGGDSSSKSTSTSSPPQPIMLSGSEGFSINTEMQGQMPTELAPATGTTLTGEVGTIDSSVWVGQSQVPKKDSILKGIGITCLFLFFMMMVPMLMMGWADESWDDSWHYETLNVDWDESGLNGTFQISNTPIDDCSLSIYNEIHHYLGDEDPNSFHVNGGCGGDDYLHQNKEMIRVQFVEGQGEVSRVTFDNLSEDEAVFTVYPRYYEQPNDSIELHLPSASPPEIGVQSFDENMTPLEFIVNTTNWAESCPQTDDLMIIENGAAAGNVEYTPTKETPYTECHLTYTDYHYEFIVYPGINDEAFYSVTLSLPEQQSNLLGSQTFDESRTPLIFPVYTNGWDNYCAQEIRMSVTDQGIDWYYPNYEVWGSPPLCPNMVYYDHYEIDVGSIDYDSGYGELFLSEPLEEGIILKVDYVTESDDSLVRDFGPCFGGLFSFVLFVVWIVQVVRNFQAGLTNKGTGMLVGIIPGVILSWIISVVFYLMMFGF
ncbi:MAG: hypothetical protein CXT67_03075 [Methanobacteriota archaeon]|jgi:hypothetical protein|nr:MAG: hypothetical protein CXT67_03075 [Euryarchaeota archaeon]HIG19602.1 hypothetical protein [Candidatus Poseidoniales archaeon]